MKVSKWWFNQISLRINNVVFIFAILLFLSVVLIVGVQSTKSDSGTYSEDFVTMTYCDLSYTNVTGWGSGAINLPQKSTPFVGTYDTPGHAYSVFVAQNYAYIADGRSGLQIVNISNSINPSLVGSCDTPFSAYGVFVDGNYAYIADGDSGLLISDISDLTNPTLIGSYNTPSFAYGVFVEGDYAYIADWGSGLQVVNISDPTTPTFADSYDTPGSAMNVVVVGNYAYVAAGFSGLRIIDISDPKNLTLAGFYDTSDYAFDVFIVGDYAYVADDLEGLKVVNISNPTSPTLAGSYDTPGNAMGVSVMGNYAYIAASGAGLLVVDITNPLSPTLADSYNTSNEVWDVFVVGDYAYIANSYTGLQILDIMGAVHYEQLAIAQSLTVASSSSSALLSNVTLTCSDSVPSGTSIKYFLSSDNGLHWEQITLGLEHSFIHTGNQLKWKAILMTSDSSKTPTISSLSISYITSLTAPSLLLPVDGFITNDTTPAFQWESVSGASSYVIQLDITINFDSSNLITKTVTSTTYTPTSALSENTWYWRVASKDSGGDIGGPSSPRHFIIDTTCPTLDHPEDITYEWGTSGHSITWNPSDTNPASYKVTRNGTVIASNSWDGSSIIINIDGLSLGIYIFICNVYDQVGYSVSDTVMLIVTGASSLTITFPTSSSIWNKGTSCNIQWESTGTISAIKIELYKGSTLELIITANTSNDGFHSWIVDSSLMIGTDYRIKITEINNTSVYDYSDYFAIEDPLTASISTTSPPTVSTSTTSAPISSSSTTPTSNPSSPVPTPFTGLYVGLFTSGIVVILVRRRK